MYFFIIVYCITSRCHGHQDPHKELLGKNVLMVRGSLEKTAEHFKMAEEEVGRLLTGARETLFREWLSRPKPHRDDKMLTAWNGG